MSIYISEKYLANEVSDDKAKSATKNLEEYHSIAKLIFVCVSKESKPSVYKIKVVVYTFKFVILFIKLW